MRRKEQLRKLQKLYDCEKEKSNDSELKISDFREEALKVKKEKNEVI